MSYSVVIPTKRTFHQIEPLLCSLVAQILAPQQIVIVYDHLTDGEGYRQYRQSVENVFTPLSGLLLEIVHPQSDTNFCVGKGASYVRNYGRKKVISDWMMFVDDDNTFDEEMMEEMMEGIMVNDEGGMIHTIIVPVQHDEQGQVRAAVADGFSFALCRPRWLTHELNESADRYQSLMLASSNCLIGPTALFAKYPFRQDVPFVYEDMIMTGEMSRDGISIVCDTWVTVVHHHGDRSPLAELYADTPERAYHKSKHRIILIHTIGQRWDIVWFYLIGFVGQAGWLVIHIVHYAPVRQWRRLVSAIVRGSWDGIKEVGRK